MSFIQVKASMTMREKLRQVRSTICMNWQEITHTRLEPVIWADNPYSLISISGRNHLKGRRVLLSNKICAGGSGAPIAEKLY
jgi:hypothetical protein